MKEIIKQIKARETDVNVSIVLNTHRTKPDNQQDRILLKNLVKQAEERLLMSHDKQRVQGIMDHLNQCAESIDHNYNLEGLILFANGSHHEYHRIPVQVKDRVAIGPTFATRDLIRAQQMNTEYYILTISRPMARLFQAHTDQIIKEFHGEFPMKSDAYTTDTVELTSPKSTDHLVEEFFNQVDKQLVKILNGTNAQVVILGDSRNYDHYIKVADLKSRIAGNVHGNFDHESNHHIVTAAWAFMNQKRQEALAQRIDLLRSATDHGKSISDPSEIWTALQEGKGQTLFVDEHYYLPAIVSGKEISLNAQNQPGDTNRVEDIIDEMIEKCLEYGGDVVFVKGDGLKDYQGLALATRF